MWPESLSLDEAERVAAKVVVGWLQVWLRMLL
jgi:hypothetical protein